MGNSATRCTGMTKPTTGAVILSNGTVFNYQCPLTAAELMLDHPQEMVVEMPPIHQERIHKKPTPLPADHNLDPNKLYAMIPIRKGKQQTLSYQQVQNLLTKTSPLLKSKGVCSYTGFLPFLIRTCPAVEAGEETNGTEKGSKSDCFTEIFDVRPEVLKPQLSAKVWKPSLDPIRENLLIK